VTVDIDRLVFSLTAMVGAAQVLAGPQLTAT
jgi:hypothetical protein